MKIKGWDEFQHFKDRTPPWIKLYRYLLDDPEWHELSGDDSKILVMLWLIASEDKAMEGNLPNIKNLAFRLRITESKLKQSLNKLYHWVIFDDIIAISDRYQHDAPETETETETETYLCAKHFETFWQHYPKKTGKDAAKKSWMKLKPHIDNILYALSWQKNMEQWQKQDGQFIPNPATYLNQGRWKDEPIEDNGGQPF
jgi:hypothetical protein